MAQELWKKGIEYHECLDVTGLPEKIIREVFKIVEDVADGVLDATSEVVSVTENVVRETGNAAGNVVRETGSAAENIVRETGNVGRNVEREVRRTVCNIIGCKSTNFTTTKEVAVLDFSDDLCVDVSAEIALIYDGAFFIRMKAFKKEFSYKLEEVHNNCTQVYNFGIGSINLCYRDIKFENDKLQSIRLSVEIQIGMKVKYGDLEKDLSTSQEVLNVQVDLV